MTIGLLKNILETRPQGKALLGLDVGKKTIGLALSDPAQNIATPLETINRTKFTRDMEALSKIITEYEIGGFVIGLPISMNGQEGRRAQSMRDFAAEMQNFLSSASCGSTAGSVFVARDPAIKSQDDSSSVWIALWDERLSTVSVEDLVDNFVDKRKTKINAKSSGLIDKLAAQVILQGALDFMD